MARSDPGRRAASDLVASCVWLATPELIVALDGRFGEPLDTYVNGSQVWLRDDGPGGAVLEWRLHPVGGYERPAGTTTEEIFSSVALALGTGAPTVAPLAELWDGLEAFPVASGTDLTALRDRGQVSGGTAVAPLDLAAAAVEAIGIEPDGVGLVDHGPVGDEWERTSGRSSIIVDLLAQLGV